MKILDNCLPLHMPLHIFKGTARVPQCLRENYHETLAQ